MPAETDNSLAIWQQVTAELAATSDPQALGLIIAHQAIQWLAADSACVYAADPPLGRLRLLASDGSALDWPAQRDFNSIPAGAAAEHGEPVFESAGADAVARLPMRWRQQTVGVIELHAAQPFSAPIRARMQPFADQAASALGNARLQAAALRQAERLAIVQRASQPIARSLEVGAVCRATYAAVGQVVPNQAFAIALLDERAQTLEAIYLMDCGERQPELRLPANSGLARLVLETGQPLLLRSPADWPAGVTHFGKPEPVQSAVVVPLRSGEHLLGILTTQAYQPEAFSDDDVPLLLTLANQAAAAIHNARLFESSKRQSRELDVLLKAQNAAAASLDLPHVLSAVAEQLGQALNVTSAYVTEVTETHAVTVAEYYGPQASPAERVSDLHASYPLEQFRYAHRSLADGAPITLSVSDPAVPAAEREHMRQYGAQTALVVPLQRQGRPLGYVSLWESRYERVFSEAEQGLARAIAGNAAVAMENARLFAEARQRAAEVSALLSTTLAVSSSMDLDARLQAIAEHALRLVAADSCTIYQLRPDGKTLLPRVALDELYAQETLNDVVIVGEGLIGRSVQSGAPVLANRADLDPRAMQIPGTPPTPECMMVVPLQAGARLTGGMAVYREGSREFSQHDLDLLSSFAAQAAVAIENAELYQKLRERADSLQSAYNELAESDRLKDEMVQNISHELRTPLTFLKSYVELLLSGALGPLQPEQGRSLQVVMNKTGTLVRLVNDIITLQAVTPATINRTQLDLLELARAAADGVAAVAQESEVVLVTQLPAGPIAVRGDSLRLSQVFDNLLGNAIKFTGRGGQIFLSVSTQPNWVRVEVRDTGVGIAPEFVERIFDRFYQVDGTLTRRRGGIGLGLAICKLIVEVHGGQIGVESQVGAGSAFYFTLPLADAG